ncbi:MULTISPECIES: FecR family protein [Thalassospira]|uniref:FecR family protein n=1 Tax=Thalassospira aquimaris TaxID=3037796 RepID=A0ABT6GAD7_9PROT|nr:MULTISPECIES: FecR family protein [Thalassospira]MDG4718974.1 FecR family protein [Thalassospira sp. FZY0004]
MTDRQGMSHEPVSEQLFDEAVIWHTHLREANDGTGSDHQEDLIRQFEKWKSLSADHIRAVEEVEQLWGRLALPVKRQLQSSDDQESRAHQTVQKRRGYMRPVMAVAMAACLLLFIGLGQNLYPTVMGMLDDDFLHAQHSVLTKSLSDGSVIKLNAGSTVSVDFDEKTRRIGLVKGEAWFDVAHDPQRPFVVHTKFGNVTALGTEFNMRSDAEQVKVSLEQGKVAVNWSVDGAGEDTDGDNATVTLVEGEATTLSSRGIGESTRFDRVATTAWRKGKMVFYQTPLSEVLDVLNTYHDGHIVALNPELNGLSVSGVFRTDDIEQVLDAIKGTLSVRVVRLTNYMILLV